MSKTPVVCRPAKAQTSLHICAVWWSEPLLVSWYFMSVKLLSEQHLEFHSLNGGCTYLSESTLVKMPHCWKSHVTAHLWVHNFQWFMLQDPDLYEEWKFDTYPNIVQVLDEFPSLKIPPSLLLTQLPILQQRYYSISSSSNMSPGEVHATVAVVKYTTQGKYRVMCKV